MITRLQQTVLFCISTRTPGKYNVCLKIETMNNGIIDCQNKYCTTVNTNCSASFYYYNYNNDTLQSPSSLLPTIYFVDNSEGNIKNRLWDFGDGSNSSSQNPVHTFNPGSYRVCLTIEGNTGDTADLCQDTFCDSIKIIQTASCFADFYEYPDSTFATTCHFADASSGNPTAWFWSFGDDSVSALKNPVHKYAKPGYYNVCLSIVNNITLCSDMICFNIYAGAASLPCQAAFEYLPDTAAGANTSFDFVNISKGNSLKFLWSFGDVDASTKPNPVYSFPHTGVFNVCLTISDSLDQVCYNKFCQTVFVSDRPSSCQAFFVFSPDSAAPGPDYYKFYDKTSGKVSKHYWDFGDNSSDTAANPEHQYLHPGLYYPCLTIYKDSSLCQNIYCSQIFIPGGNDICLARFSYQKAANVLSLPSSGGYQFSDNSQVANLSSHSSFWEFGDGTTSKEQNPVHIFYPGTYKVCLTIASAPSHGSVCNDTYCNIITIDTIVPPASSACNNYFTVTYDTKDSLAVHFFGNTAYSSLPLKGVIWQWGDGLPPETSQNLIASHHYMKGGTYTASLTTIDSLGCEFTSTQTVYVNAKNGFGNIEGQVFAGGKTADRAIVIIASIPNSQSSTLNSFSYLDSAYVDSIGGYHFNKIPFGQYYVLSYLQPASKYYSAYLPTFFGNKWYWADAATVDLSSQKPSLSTVNINLINVPESYHRFRYHQRFRILCR